MNTCIICGFSSRYVSECPGCKVEMLECNEEDDCNWHEIEHQGPGSHFRQVPKERVITKPNPFPSRRMDMADERARIIARMFED